MTPERWIQVRDVLASAMQLQPGDCSVYLDHRCSADSDLRDQVNELLIAEEEVRTDFLESLVHAESVLVRLKAFTEPGYQFKVENKTLIGCRVGSYQIVEEIGSGGMGEVYRAFRADDQYRQQVAVKVARRGRNSEAVLERFRNERQILADLDHPNIARILDGGTAEAGDPFFVMELIDGLPIDQYCDRRALPITERLQLFCQVCSAVEYAHRHLIVHRDIKPGNILVTAPGVAKLLDFGIAKILGAPSIGGQVQANTAMHRPLTPGYASPEQVTGATITTASDVYSLGVVLYELLTGRSPYQLSTHMPQELVRAVCQIEPEKLSLVVCRHEPIVEEDGLGANSSAAIAAARQTSPGKLSKKLNGDLDNIVLMALRKEPQRRYASVDEFAQDLRHHLEKLPVIACKATFGYRATKFVVRHKAGVAATAVLIVGLIIGLAVTVRAMRIAQAQQARAERHFNDLRELSNSLIFDVHDSIQDLPGSTPARKLIVEKALKYLDRLSSDVGDDFTLKRELATAYEKVAAVQGNPFGANLGDTQGSMASYRKSAAIWEFLASANAGNIHDWVSLARTRRQLAGVIANSGGADPLEMAQQAVGGIEQLKERAGPDLQILEELELGYEMVATIQYRTGGDPAAALKNLGKELTLAEQRLKGSIQDRSLQRRVAIVHVKIADSLAELGRRKESIDHSHLALEIFRSDPNYARAHRDVAILLSRLGDIQLMDGSTAAGLRSYRQEQAILEPFAKADPQDAEMRYDLAYAYARVGHALSRGSKYIDALAMLDKAMRILEPMARAPEHAEARSALAVSHIWMGEALAQTGKVPQALENLRKGSADFLSLVTLLNWDCYYRSSLAASHTAVGNVLTRMGRFREAASEYQMSLGLARALALAKPQDVLPLYTIADAYSGMGDLARTAAVRSTRHPDKRLYWSEARDWYQLSIDAWRKISNPGINTSAGFKCGEPAKVVRALAEAQRMCNVGSVK